MKRKLSFVFIFCSFSGNLVVYFPIFLSIKWAFDKLFQRTRKPSSLLSVKSSGCFYSHFTVKVDVETNAI